MRLGTPAGSAPVHVLVIDTDGEVHAAIRQILTVEPFEMVIDERSVERPPAVEFDVDAAASGDEALCVMMDAQARDRAYALVFLDLALSAGLDGLTTLDRICQEHPLVQVVLCSSFSDFSLRAVVARFGANDRLLFATKPFRPLEVRQLALALARRWQLERDAERHMAELEVSIRHYSEKLQEKVSHLTLQKRELAKAKYRAESASRAKTAFVASISHEIRTPLNGILGMLSILESSPLNAEQAEHVRIAALSGESLLRLINDVLDFSRIEAGRVELGQTDFTLSALVRDVISTQLPEAQCRALELTAEQDPALPDRARGDPDRLRQVLVNLVSNAIKFTPSGGITVQLRLTDRDPSGDAFVVRFEVHDTGIGIAAESMARIFDSFTQADSSITRRFGGTGLGLAICRQLVERMGGEIGVDSQLGRGSTFWFTAPLYLVQADKEVDSPSRAQAHPPARSGDIQGASVLLVEDNVVNQKVATRFLERLGCRVTVAHNGVEGAEIALRDRFDLIFMDCEMPVLDGLGATERIRDQEPGGGRVPIVALTAHVFDEVRQQCMAAGMDDHLSKPIRLPELKDVLLRWLPSSVTPDIEAAAATLLAPTTADLMDGR